MSTSAQLQERLQNASLEYQKLQTDFHNAVEAKQKLDTQLSENEQVKKEFLQLTSSNVVYKIIGPVLVKQDQVEAKDNVDKRLAFITEEIKRLEQKLKDLEDKSEEKKNELIQIQSTLQQQAGPPPVTA